MSCAMLLLFASLASAGHQTAHRRRWDWFNDNIVDPINDNVVEPINDNVIEPITDTVDDYVFDPINDNVMDPLGVPDIFNPFSGGSNPFDNLPFGFNPFNPFDTVENIWEAGEDVVEVVYDAIVDFGECLMEADLVDTENCELPLNDLPCGAEAEDGFTGWCNLGGIGFTVQFGSLEEGGDQDTATFSAKFGILEHEESLLEEEWTSSPIKEFTEITATADFLFAGRHELKIGDGNVFTLALPKIDLDFSAELGFAADHAEEPCADDEEKCTIVLNEGKTTIFQKEFAAGPVPVVIELKAEVYLKAIPSMSAAASAQFKVYLDEEVPLLNNVDFILADPQSTVENMEDMFDPEALTQALEENIRFEVTGEIAASATMQVCLGVIVSFHVNGVGVDMDVPACLTFQFDAAASGSLSAASASVSASITLEAIESAVVLALPDPNAVIDTACAFAQLATNPGGVDVASCVPLVGCFEDLADDVCEGTSEALSELELEIELASFTFTEEEVLWDYSGDWSTEQNSDLVGMDSGTDLVVKSSTGYCPNGYTPILDQELCEFYSNEILGLPDSNGLAYVFTHSNPSISRPRGCYWNGGNANNLAFNKGVFDALANDGYRKIICAKEQGIVSPKGYCPSGYQAITSESQCESIAIGALDLPDSNGQAYVFSNSNAGSSRPRGCYWNEASSPNLAFNTGLYDSNANDGQRKIICKPASGPAPAPQPAPQPVPAPAPVPAPQPSFPSGPMAKKSNTGYCPSGYTPILDEALCEYYAVEILGLPDSNGQAFVFSNSNAGNSRPQGCYWNGGSANNLAFNTGLYDANANDGIRKIICAKESGIVSPKGYCPSGYQAITSESQCESIAIDALNLPDSNGQAYVFSNSNAGNSRPRGCYWNDGSSPNLAFNTGLYDSNANDGQRKIICKPSSGSGRRLERGVGASRVRRGTLKRFLMERK